LSYFFISQTHVNNEVFSIKKNDEFFFTILSVTANQPVAADPLWAAKSVTPSGSPQTSQKLTKTYAKTMPGQLLNLIRFYRRNFEMNQSNSDNC